MIESVSAPGELVGVQLYEHPWVMGEYWPMITPCFRVRATDDGGNEYTGMPGDWRGFPGNEGTGRFFLLAAGAHGPHEHAGDGEHVVGGGLGRN